MNNKLKILVGISGSSKSTWAHKKWLTDTANTIIVSRDTIRYMYGYTESNISNYYINKGLRFLEEKVSEIEDMLINNFLEKGYDVICDNTHLKAEYLNKYNSFDCKKEIIIFDIDLEEAIKRDSERTRKVGSRVIEDQYKKYKNLVEFLKNNKLKYEYDLQEISVAG